MTGGARAIALRMWCGLLLMASACTSMPPVSRLAANAGIAGQVVTGTGFRHRLFANAAAESPHNGPLLVFLEGDGQPWVDGGRTPARDPTPRQPLAFELFVATRQPAWYLTRPCYEHLIDPGCRTGLWTSARYSTEVVDSMAAALRSNLAQYPAQDIMLIGYSGGGVLATLLAPRLPRVAGIITIAANLDVAAWAQLHGYLPLVDSLDPAREPARLPAHVLLTGDRDENVPVAVVAGYLATHPGVMEVHYPAFDHVCCWRRDWNEVLPRALQALASGGGGG
jgi:pimeloyl-ACP methyl ester carboxylesterase